MKHFNRIALLLTLSLSSLVFAQTKETDAPGVRLEVTVSRYESDQEVSRLPFNFLIMLDRQATLKITKPVTSLPPESVPACFVSTPTSQEISTQVESKVTSAGDSKFIVHLVITERSPAGCRSVGDLTVPVYTNRVSAHVVTLKAGETVGVPAGSGPVSGESRKLEVKLAVVAR